MSDNKTLSGKFPLGQIVATRNALSVISQEDIQEALIRHVQGDWGTLCDDDRNSNEQALMKGGRLFSAYQSSQNVKFWIITEHDRSVTTILLPEDY